MSEKFTCQSHMFIWAIFHFSNSKFCMLMIQWKCCLYWKHSDLVSLLSSWVSTQWLFDRHPCQRIFQLCCFWSLSLAAESKKQKMDLLRSSRSSCPSRLSRLHPWFWQSHMDRWWCCHSPEHQSGWTATAVLSHSPLLLFLSSSGCLSSCHQGISVR